MVVQDNPDVTASGGGGGGNVAGVEVTSTGPSEEPAFHAAEELPKSLSTGEKPTNIETNEKVVSPRSVFVFVHCVENPFAEWGIT